MKKASTRLREIMERPGIIVAPGVYDGLSAQLATRAGFKVLYMTGAGVSLGTYGMPDVGLLTLTEMAAAVARITNVTDRPLIADADTGYGNAINVRRMIREYEKAGVASLHLEDQVTPKKCGHLGGKQVVDAEEMCLKIEAARDASTDPDLVIIARTDSRQALGLDEAIRRARLCVEAGADVVFVEAPQGKEEIARVPREIDGPCMMNMGGKSLRLPARTLEEMGYKFVIFPGEAQRAIAFAVQEVYRVLREAGEVESIKDRLMSWEERFRLSGVEEIRELEDRFLPQAERTTI